MYKAILAPLFGQDMDDMVLDTALTVARTCGAHIECCCPDRDTGASPSRPVARPYLVGGTRAPLVALAVGERAQQVRRRYADFCKLYAIGQDSSAQDVTAHLDEACGGGVERLLALARHHDLVVMNRCGESDGLPADALARLLLQGGPPLLLASAYPAAFLLRHAMICWKDSAACARAIRAALPILVKAQRVTVLHLDEGLGPDSASSAAVVRHLAWHGVKAVAAEAARGKRSAMDALAFNAFEQHADLLVMGGYSHGPLKEALFGGCTRSVLEHADVPVLIAH
jgi:nucleotide-binding universal stress UspA family protein